MGEVSGPGADGGSPFSLNGSIVLCGRSDGDAERFFDGSIAYLGETRRAPLRAVVPSATASLMLWRRGMLWHTGSSIRDPVALWR